MMKFKPSEKAQHCVRPLILVVMCPRDSKLLVLAARSFELYFLQALLHGHLLLKIFMTPPTPTRI